MRCRVQESVLLLVRLANKGVEDVVVLASDVELGVEGDGSA